MSFEKNKIIQEIRALIRSLEKAGIRVKAGYLFGSYAKDEAREWSDIDIAIISDDFCGVKFYDFKRLIPFLRGHNTFIEIHPFKTEDFDPEDDLFAKEIVETGIKIK